MLENIKDSIKAKLYDFTYTPFMSSFVISWVILNHKYLLIYFGDEKVVDKIKLLNDHIFDKIPFMGYNWWIDQFWYPFGISLGYVFVYPLFALGFYAATLWYKKWSKDIKVYIEKLTIIPEKEAAKIHMDISRLEDEKDIAVKKLRDKEDEYNNQLGNLKSEIYNINSKFSHAKEQIEQLKTDKEQLENQLSEIRELLSAKNDECSTRKNEAANLAKQLALAGIVNEAIVTSGEQIQVDTKLEDDRTKVLRYFYEKNYKTTTETNAIDQIIEFTQLARPKAKLLVDSLTTDEILSKNGNYLEITDIGNKKLVELFDNV